MTRNNAIAAINKIYSLCNDKNRDFLESELLEQISQYYNDDDIQYKDFEDLVDNYADKDDIVITLNHCSSIYADVIMTLYEYGNTQERQELFEMVIRNCNDSFNIGAYLQEDVQRYMFGDVI